MDRRYTRAHRQRKGTRKTVEVLDSESLALKYGVALADLEAELQRRGIKYHKDATGRIFA